MKKISVCLLFAACLLISGCVNFKAPVQPPVGLFYSNFSAPIDTDAARTPASGRFGEASSTCVLGIFAFGDSSTVTCPRYVYHLQC